MGKVTKDATAYLAFQFAIDNVGKIMEIAASKNGWVVPKVTTMSCKLSVGTWSSDTASATVWYAPTAKSVNVDGGSASVWGKYDSYIVWGNQPSIGASMTYTASAANEAMINLST
jgi:hypothetical protein